MRASEWVMMMTEMLMGRLLIKRGPTSITVTGFLTAPLHRSTLNFPVKVPVEHLASKLRV